MAEAALDQAIARAATLLGGSRCAVIACLGTDVAGAEAAIAMARRIGAVFDHAASAAALAELAVMREAGWVVTSPIEARARADVVLLVGAGLVAAWPEYAVGLGLAGPPPLVPEANRRVFRLCPGEEPVPAGIVETIAGYAEQLPVMLGLLRATLAGRPVARAVPGITALAEALRAARYGVAVWSAAAIEPLAIEMVCGLVDDLNGTTRFAGLPLPGADNVNGVTQAAAWCCGFPPRTSFGRGVPEHDPWRFDATRLVESGEADAVLWISALTAASPPWTRRLPTVALSAPGTAFATPPEVAITVGRPGHDHAGVLHAPRLGALAAHPAVAASDALPTVDRVIGGIMAALPC
jgi:formylmethanofuran dehydrogenase subunit B